MEHNPINQIRPHKGFSSIEREGGCGIFLQECIEKTQIKIKIPWKVGIDVDSWCGFIIALFQYLKCLCPAVPAAEVTFVSEDEMEIHAMLFHMGCCRR